jgi:hypothetical protein
MATNLTSLGALATPQVNPMTAAQALLPLTTVLRRNSAATNAVSAGGPIRHTSQLSSLRYSPLTGNPETTFSLSGSTQDFFATNAALLQMAAAGNAASQAQAQLAAFAAAGVPCSVGQTFGLSSVGTGATPTGATNGIPRSTSPSGGFTIIVANLGSEAEESLLWRLFGPFGAVLSVKVSIK